MENTRRTFIGALLGIAGLSQCARSRPIAPRLGQNDGTCQRIDRYRVNPEWDKAHFERIAVFRPLDREGFVAIIERGSDYTPPKGFVASPTGTRLAFENGEWRQIPMRVRG